MAKRNLAGATILFFAFFSWYFVFSLLVIQQVPGLSPESYLLANTSFNFIIALTILLASFFVHKFNELHTMYVTCVIISAACVSLLFVLGTILKLVIIITAGIFFGLGQLAFLRYFWTVTTSIERGRVAGIIAFFSIPFTYITVLMAEPLDFSGTVVLGALLVLPILAVKLLKPENTLKLTAKKDEKNYRPEKRTLFFYSFPWILFSIINTTLAGNLSHYVSQNVQFPYAILVILQLVASAFGALIGGILADFFGRKLSLVFSLTLYGISSIVIGLFENPQMFYFSYIANGLNWGVLVTLYILVIWGDLADKRSCDKRYSIGLIIFYSTAGVGRLLTYQTSLISPVISVLIICSLIFLSNVSLIFAPELLSADFREKIKFRVYINVVKKIRKQSQNQG